MSDLYWHPEKKIHQRAGIAFTLDGVQYPANWPLASLGFVPVVTVGEQQDQQMYWINEQLHEAVMTITSTPKDVDLLSATESLRLVRDGMLMDSDWTDLPNAPLTTEEKIAWQEVRKELRDATEYLAVAWDEMAIEEKLRWNYLPITPNKIMDLIGRDPWEE